MLKQILDVLRKRSVMIEVEAELRQMLDLSKSLFEAASAAFADGAPVEFDLYARDREINARVVDIRKKIVEHLAISESRAVSGELVFITLINDVERIGDYSKNLLEIARALEGPPLPGRYLNHIREARPGIVQAFDEAGRALFDSDQAAAHAVIERHAKLSEVCEGIVKELLRDQQMKARDAVAFALVARYFKRVSSHLKNVASSAVNPFSLIGYKQAPDASVIMDDE